MSGFANPRPDLAISAGTGLVSNGTVILSNAQVTFGMQLSASSHVVTVSITGTGLSTAVRSVSVAGVSGGLITNTGVSFANAALVFGMAGQIVTAMASKAARWVGGLNIQASISGLNTSLVMPFNVWRESFLYAIDATRAQVSIAITQAQGSQGTFTLNLGMYSFSRSTASLASSTSFTYSFTSGTNTADASQYAGISSVRLLEVPLGTWNIVPGDYYIAYSSRMSGVSGSIPSMSLGVLKALASTLRNAGTAVRSGFFGPGFLSYTSGAFPGSVHLSDVIQTWPGIASAGTSSGPVGRLAVTLLGSF